MRRIWIETNNINDETPKGRKKSQEETQRGCSQKSETVWSEGGQGDVGEAVTWGSNQVMEGHIQGSKHHILALAELVFVK